MGIPIEQAKAMGIDVSKLNLRDRVSEMYGVKGGNQNSKQSFSFDITKYGTKKRGYFYKGKKFKSELEIKRYDFLEMCKNVGLISDFDYEPEKFVLQEGFKFNGKTYYITTYTPDFKITLKNGYVIYEDTKSDPTSKNSTYKVKSKFFVANFLYGKEKVDFREVFKAEENYFKEYLIFK